MADTYDFADDGQTLGYEIPEDQFTRPGSSYLNIGGFEYTPEDTSPLLQTSQEKYDAGMAEHLGMPLDAYLAVATPTPEQGATTTPGAQDWLAKLESVAKTLGLTKKDGSGYDWSKIIGLGAAGLTLNDTLNQSAQPVKTAAQLLAGIPSNTPGALTTAVPLLAGNQLTRQYAADMPSVIRPGGRGYACGGEVTDGGALSKTFDSSRMLGIVTGEGGGQDDMVSARLSPGEYVFDAELVSMLGDGDNEAGARKLDELREAVRAHKRAAPDDEIAPRAKGPLSYMKGGLNG